MVKIRTTETLATSDSLGLCDISREMEDFNFSIKSRTITTIVKDVLFQERNVTKTVELIEEGEEIVREISVIERKIIEVKTSRPYVFKIDDIDQFYQLIGVSITKSKGFSKGLKENLVKVLIEQTKEAKRQTMENWIEDVNNYELVSEFTK